MKIHTEDKCQGTYCPFHNPSDHHMKDWPKVIKMSGLIERTCEHNVGHPDPDSVDFFEKVTGDSHWGVHGCDGCCNPTETNDEV